MKYIINYLKLIKEFWLKNYNLILNNIVKITLILSVLTIIIFIIQLQIKKAYSKKLYTTVKNKNSHIKNLTNKLSRNKYLKLLIENTANQLSIFNDYSFEKNKEYATVFIIVMFILVIVTYLVMFPTRNIIWYMLIFWLIVVTLFIYMILYVLNLFTRAYFLKYLPKTYKLLNSRYIITKDMMKSINKSLKDFDKPVKREMRRIYSIKRENDKIKIMKEFNLIKRKYNNFYLTLLLNLIETTDTKGDKNNAVKEQLEYLTDEVLDEIENKKRLSATARMYIIMVIYIPFILPFIEKYIDNTFKIDSSQFYLTPKGQLMKMLIIIMVMIYVFILLVLEKR